MTELIMATITFYFFFKMLIVTYCTYLALKAQKMDINHISKQCNMHADDVLLFIYFMQVTPATFLLFFHI